MKASFTKRSCGQITVAASALVGALTLVTGPAFAATYIAHKGLTPYQIVSSTGTGEKCVEYYSNNRVLLQPCSDTGAQTFYVLKGPSGADGFVPEDEAYGVDDLRNPRDVRIVAARMPNTSIVSFLTYSLQGSLVNLQLGDGSPNRVWHVKQAQQWEETPIWAEDATVSPVQTRLVRFGLGNVWVYKEVNPKREVPCTSAFFESDPHPPGDPLGVDVCQKWGGSPDHTPYKVTFNATGAMCLVATTSSPTKGSCSAESAVWTLRPTKYPQ